MAGSLRLIRTPPVDHDPLDGFAKVSLDRLKLATDILLGEAGSIPDTLEVELTLYRERLERSMLLPRPAGTGR
jgi:hypothetical protein